MQAGIAENTVALRELLNGGGAEFVRFRHGTGCVIRHGKIAANKVRGARAALCHDEYTARFARRHNNANVLSIGARLIAPELAMAILDVFLTEEFEGGRHVARLDQLTAIEDEEAAKS